MSKTKIILIVLSLIIIIGLIIYFLINKKDESSTVNVNTQTKNISVFPLTLNSSGNEVKSLQEYLNLTASKGLTINGNFDDATSMASFDVFGTNVITQDLYNSKISPYINLMYGFSQVI